MPCSRPSFLMSPCLPCHGGGGASVGRRKERRSRRERGVRGGIKTKPGWDDTGSCADRSMLLHGCFTIRVTVFLCSHMNTRDLNAICIHITV